MSKELRTEETSGEGTAGETTTETVEKNVPKQRRTIRITATVPAIFSLATFILVIILVVSGSKPGRLEEYKLLTLNTSKLGQDLIQFTPTTSTKAKRANPLDPLGLLPTASSSSSAAASTTGPFDALESFFNGILQNVTASVDGGLNDAEAELIAEAVEALGIQDFYSLHLLDICSGNLSGTGSDAKFDVSQCVSYSDSSGGLTNISSSIPSSLTILTTNVSIPILSDLASATRYISSQTITFSKTIFAFYIISLVGSCVSFLCSLAGIFLSASHILIYLNLGFSTLGIIFQLAASIAATIMVSLIAGIINSFGNSIGLQAVKGEKFLILTWVAFALLQLVGFYWFAVWYVEVRKSSFKKRRRAEGEVGNWKGIFGEMKSDLKGD